MNTGGDLVHVPTDAETAQQLVPASWRTFGRPAQYSHPLQVSRYAVHAPPSPTENIQGRFQQAAHG